MNVFITGIDGFVGGHLGAFLVEQGCRVLGIGITDPTKIGGDYSYAQLDICDEHSLGKTIADFHPDLIFHLAAISFVPEAQENPHKAVSVNVTGGINVLECVAKFVPRSKVIVISTGEVYGIVSPDELPLGEDHPIKPANVYATTKASLELFSSLYVFRNNTDAVLLRPFNHIGPGQSPRFVTSDFAKQIAAIEKGIQSPELLVGNLDVIRDFTDVRDIVKAYYLASKDCERGEVYNIASGKGVKISEILEILLSLTDKKITITQDTTKFREAEVPAFIGDYSQFHKVTGWRPEIGLKQTLQDILDYWRERV
ncbi:GDP-mannose 4,6-dehydratase [Chlamydiota bacterium]